MTGLATHQFCLKWNNHSNNLLKVFGRLFSNESFTDVTLAAEGRSVRAHKVRLPLPFTGFYLVLLGFTGFYWVSLDSKYFLTSLSEFDPVFTGFYRV